MDDYDGPQHVWLRTASPGEPIAYSIVHDASVETRRRAAWRLERRLSGEPPSRNHAGFRPTPFQRQRLDLLVRILDLLLAPAGRPTSHEIARRLIYPAMTIGRGMEWKSSSERRRTQRLIDEALAQMRGGYRALLRGAVGGATKVACVK